MVVLHEPCVFHQSPLCSHVISCAYRRCNYQATSKMTVLRVYICMSLRFAATLARELVTDSRYTFMSQALC